MMLPNSSQASFVQPVLSKWEMVRDSQLVSTCVRWSAACVVPELMQASSNGTDHGSVHTRLVTQEQCVHTWLGGSSASLCLCTSFEHGLSSLTVCLVAGKCHVHDACCVF